MRATLLAALATLGACAHAPALARRAATPPGTVAVFADTTLVRRLCVAPDDVIAGRSGCLLRDQRSAVRVF